MSIDTDDVVRTTIGFTLGDGTIAQNIYHHLYTGLTGSSDAAVVAALDAWSQGIHNRIDGMIKDDVVANLQSVDQVAWVVDKWEITRHVGTFTMSFNPTGTGDMLPNQSSAFITFKTVRPKTVGRKFLIPFEEPWQAGSFLAAGAVADIVLMADDILQDINLGGIEDLHPGVIRTGVDSFLAFTLAVVTNVLGSQRRRRPGEGA